MIQLKSSNISFELEFLSLCIRNQIPSNTLYFNTCGPFFSYNHWNADDVSISLNSDSIRL